MSRYHAIARVLCTAMLVLGLAGCLSPGEVALKRQFLLAPNVVVDKASPTAHTLGIRPLSAARPYTLTMLYANEEGALLPRADVFWAEEPAVTVARALRDAIAQSGRFADVGDAADLARPEYVLTGELRKFYEDRSATPPMATVEVRLELRQVRDAQQVWAGTCSGSAALGGDTAAMFARAMESATETVSAQAASAIIGIALP